MVLPAIPTRTQSAPARRPNKDEDDRGVGQGADAGTAEAEVQDGFEVAPRTPTARSGADARRPAAPTVQAPTRRGGAQTSSVSERRAQRAQASRAQASGESARAQRAEVAPLTDRQYLRATMSPSAMRRALTGDRLEPEQRRELIQRVVRSPTEFRRLLDRTGSGGLAAYAHDREVIAAEIRRAHADGDITDADLRTLMAQLGPEDARRTVNLLAHDPESSAPGGPLEVMGLEAQRLARENPDAAGYETAALLALSSSQELADRHFPEGPERTAAFERLERLLAEDRRFAATNPPEGGPYPNDRLDADLFGNRAQAVASWLRLAPEGTSPQTVRAQLETLGSKRRALIPFLSGPGDRSVEASSPMSRVIAATEGRPEHRTLYAMAVTSDPALIDAHAPEPEQLYGLLDTLTADLESDDRALELANEQGYQARANQGSYGGIANLLGHRGADLLGHIFKDPRSRRTMAPRLEEALSRTLFAVPATEGQRTKIQEALADFVATRIDGEGDPSNDGLEAGQLMGTIHNAADVARARESSVEVRGFFENVLGRTMGKVAGALVGRWGLIVDPLVNTSARPEVDRRKLEEAAEEAFIKRLKAEGVDIDELGPTLREDVQQDLTNRIDRLFAILDTADLTEEEQAILERYRARLESTKTGITEGYDQARNRRIQVR